MVHLNIKTPEIPRLGQQPKLITCVIPDDGTDLELLKNLRTKGDIITATSYQSRWVCSLTGATGSAGKKRRGLAAQAVRVLSVVVAEGYAEEIFQYIYDQTQIGEPNGGLMYMGPLGTATLFSLPDGVADETH